MKMSPRASRGLVLEVESKEESRHLDELFGKKVDDEGLIATGQCEIRLSDGYGEHYVYLKKINVDADLLRRLDEAGSTGLDLSPGDPLAADAAKEIRRLS